MTLVETNYMFLGFILGVAITWVCMLLAIRASENKKVPFANATNEQVIEIMNKIAKGSK